MRHITTHDAPATGMRGMGDTNWQIYGACYGMDPADADAVFFALPRDLTAITDAKALCGECPVRSACLNYALEHSLKDGIWGGLTPTERRPFEKGLSRRLDYSRVLATFQGRNVHLTTAERQTVIDHAYVRGWRADRLAVTLRVSYAHAQDLLKQAEHKIGDRDLTLGVPRHRQKKRQKRGKQPAPAASDPDSDESATEQPASPPVQTTAAHAAFGKAA